MEDRLRHAPAFADLPDDKFAEIMAMASEVSFPKETTVIEEGADAKGLYVLVDGELTVTKWIRGRSVMLNHLEPVTFVDRKSVV